MSAHLSSLALERALRGHAPGQAQCASHLASCPDCARRLDEMRAEDQAYLATPQAQQLRARLRQAAIARRGRRWPLFLPGLAIVAAAAAFVWARPRHQIDAFSAKGGALEVAVERSGRRAAWDGSPLQDGDLVQLGWSSDHGMQLAVLVREADGRVTTVFPERGDQPAMTDGPHRLLGGSLRVDGRPLEVIAFFAESPFALPPLRAAMNQGAPLPSFPRREELMLPGTRPR